MKTQAMTYDRCSSLGRRQGSGIEYFALSASEEVPGLLEQIERRSGGRHQDSWLLYHRLPERAVDLLLHPGDPPGIDQRYGHVIETFVD